LGTSELGLPWGSRKMVPMDINPKMTLRTNLLVPAFMGDAVKEHQPAFLSAAEIAIVRQLSEVGLAGF
ncbi:MAG: hypothetical protein WCH61_05685, partial [bacterium]